MTRPTYPSLLALALTVAIPLLLPAQSERHPFGTITGADFTDREEPLDENADALYLMSYGESYINSSAEIVHTVHHRIRILREAGLSEADQEITFSSAYSRANVRDVIAHTVNQDANGRIRKTRVGRGGVFSEKVTNDISRIRITFPDVRVGSIIEFSYIIHIKGFFFYPTWYLQREYPTLDSEYVTFIPNTLQYVMVRNGFVNIEQSQPMLYRDTARRGIYAPQEGGSMTTFRARNIPALVEEPFITTLTDYQARLRFQLQGTSFTGERPQTYMSTWPKLTVDLLDADYFGKKIPTGRAVRDAYEAIAPADTLSALGRAMAIYDHVVTTFDASRGFEAAPETDFGTLLTRKTGSTADVAFALIGFLRQAGLDAYPVLVSTRRNGRVAWEYPLISQFNHVVVHLSIGSRYWLLDPVSEDIPFGMLSFESLNREGHLVKAPGNVRVPLGQRQRAREDVVADVALHADGSAGITFTFQYTQHAGVLMRQRLREQGRETVLRSLVEDVPNGELLSWDVEGFDDREAPLRISGVLRSTALTSDVGGLTLLDPALFLKWDDNPFKSANRLYPVNFGVEMEENMVLSIRIPAEWEVESLPGTKQSRVGQGALFQSQFSQRDGVVRASYTVRTTVPEFGAGDYPMLRSFFDDIVGSHAESIVLKRKP